MVDLLKGSFFSGITGIAHDVICGTPNDLKQLCIEAQ